MATGRVRCLEQPRLSAVVPMWNEEASISRTVSALVGAFDDLVATGLIRSWELILVDDGSTDATGALADALATSDPHIRAVHHDRNRALGAAIRTGFAASSGDLILYTDADLPFDPAEVALVLRTLDERQADIVAAYRLDRGDDGPRRRAYTLVYNWLVGVVLGLDVDDVNFAAKLVRRDLLDRIELRSEGSFIDAELLARAEAAGATVVQVGVTYWPRTAGTSTLSSARAIATILVEMARLAPGIRRDRARRVLAGGAADRQRG